MRDIDKNGSQILAQLLQRRGALPRCARRPALHAQKDDNGRDCNNQGYDREHNWPRDPLRFC